MRTILSVRPASPVSSGALRDAHRRGPRQESPVAARPRDSRDLTVCGGPSYPSAMQQPAAYAVLFDLDGTLVQSDDLYYRATQSMLDWVGRSLDELTPEERSRIPGRSALENMRFYSERFGLPQPV